MTRPFPLRRPAADPDDATASAPAAEFCRPRQRGASPAGCRRSPGSGSCPQRSRHRPRRTPSFPLRIRRRPPMIPAFPQPDPAPVAGSGRPGPGPRAWPTPRPPTPPLPPLPCRRRPPGAGRRPRPPDPDPGAQPSPDPRPARPAPDPADPAPSPLRPRHLIRLFRPRTPIRVARACPAGSGSRMPRPALPSDPAPAKDLPAPRPDPHSAA